MPAPPSITEKLTDCLNAIKDANDRLDKAESARLWGEVRGLIAAAGGVSGFSEEQRAEVARLAMSGMENAKQRLSAMGRPN